MEKNIKKDVQHVYVLLSHFAAQQQLTQCYKSTIIQLKEKKTSVISPIYPFKSHLPPLSSSPATLQPHHNTCISSKKLSGLPRFTTENPSLGDSKAQLAISTIDCLSAASIKAI